MSPGHLLPALTLEYNSKKLPLAHYAQRNIENCLLFQKIPMDHSNTFVKMQIPKNNPTQQQEFVSHEIFSHNNENPCPHEIFEHSSENQCP